MVGFRFLILGALVSSLSMCSAIEKGDGTRAAAVKVPVVYSPKYRLGLYGLEKLHPFDVGKYDKIYGALVKEGLVSAATVRAPEVLTEEDLLLVHTKGYLASLKNKGKVAGYLEAPALKAVPGFLFERKVVRPFLYASGGTLLAARLALKEGAAINLGGGYHHAKPEVGEGFCLFADVPIAIRRLQKEGLVKRALVIDTDIHQGNGTVRCLANDATTFCFSMHEGGIYPMPKEKGDLDVEVRAGVTDAEYLAILRKQLPVIFEKSRPDIVFQVAGCDALKGDPLANGAMTAAGIRERDLMIYRECKRRGIPYVMTLAGGYSAGAWKAQFGGVKGILEE